MTTNGPGNTLLSPLTGGLIGSLGFILLALVLLTSRKAFETREEVGSEQVPAVMGA